MSLRTLKIGDRTISYDAGLNSLEEQQQQQQQQRLNRRSLNLEEVEGQTSEERTGRKIFQERRIRLSL